MGFDLDIEATHDQPGSFRARPANVDDGLEDIRWICGLGGEKLPAASYVLLSNLEQKRKKPSEGDRDFLSSVFYTAALVSDAWPAPATYHRPFCDNCDQRVGRSP